jgi:hypothetical protein
MNNVKFFYISIKNFIIYLTLISEFYKVNIKAQSNKSKQNIFNDQIDASSSDPSKLLHLNLIRIMFYSFELCSIY